MNQAGETALDIAKRLKATQCEDLVSKTELGHPLGTSCLKMSFSETGIGIEETDSSFRTLAKEIQTSTLATFEKMVE